MTLKRNIFANYVGTGVATLAPILALPWYLSALGAELWGLVSFVVTLQAVLALLDAGMSQALVREFAIRFGSTENGTRRTAMLLRGFERIYWVFALLAGFVAIMFADILATGWLKLGTLPVEQGRLAVFGAAAISFAQLPGSVYRSLLVGAQAQIALNVIMTSGALIRHVGAVIVVSTWPTLTAYLGWHAAVALSETLARAATAWGVLRIERSQVRRDWAEIRQVLAQVTGMTGAVLLGALTVQMDKIILSRMVPIEQFGYYVIAASLAGGVLTLIYPIMQAVLPRAVLLRDDPSALLRLNFRYAGLVLLLVGAGALVFSLFAYDLIEVWLRNSAISAIVHSLLKVLLIGSALNALSTVGYINWIVKGCISRVLQVNAASLVLGLILIPLMIDKLGLIGAAVGWLTINGIGFLLSMEWLLSSKK